MRGSGRRTGRPIGLALFALTCAALGPSAAQVPPDPAPPDSLPRGAVDVLLEAWSDLYLGAWSDSLAWAPGSDSLGWHPGPGVPIQAIGGGDGNGGCRFVIMAGGEVEGLDESFGPETLLPLSSGAELTNEIAPSAPDTAVAPTIRFAERSAAPLALLGLSASTGEAAPVAGTLRIESRTGRERADVTAEAHGAPRRGAWQGLSVRELFLWDRTDDGTTTRQNLLHLRWRPASTGGGWRLGLGAAIDVGRSDGADAAIEPSGSLAADSTLKLYDLNYEKYDARVELLRPGLQGPTLSATFSRKESDLITSGAYRAGKLAVRTTFFARPGLCDLDFAVERRRYDDTGSVLGSYWEPEMRARWMGSGDARRLDAQLDVLATRYDDRAAGADDLLGLADDQLTAQLRSLVRQRLSGGYDAAGATPAAWEWEAAVGPAAELVRTRAGGGDAASLGLCLESTLRRGRGSRPMWVDLMAEFGWRAYGDHAEESRLALEGFGLSLAQSDFRYARCSLIAEGALPWSLSWEAYATLDQEWHAQPRDDARLISFSLALKRLWVLGPRSPRGSS